MKIPRLLAWPLLCLPWVFLATVMLRIVLVYVPLSGVRSFSIPLDGRSPWFDSFLPSERAMAPGLQSDGWIGQRIIDDPVYGGARTPGVYDRVAMSMEARIKNQSVVDIGILRDQERFIFALRPFWSAELSTGAWRPVASGSRRGFVRRDAPDADLLTDEMETVVVWHATTTAPLLKDEAAMRDPLSVDVSLRGNVDFFLVPMNREIRLSLLLQDMNRTKGKNMIGFRLTKDETLIATDAVSVSGELDKKPNKVFEKTFVVPNAEPGVYHLALIADDDIFIRRIKTPSRRWVVGPRLYLADQVGYATRTLPSPLVWTNSRHLVAETFHQEGRQTITFGSMQTGIEKTHQAYPIERASDERGGAMRVHAPKGDIRLVGDGYFAFQEDALFLPYPRRLTDATDLLDEGIKAVLTPYRAAEPLENGWMRLHQAFDLTDNLTGRVRFVLSAPGLKSRKGLIDVRRVLLRYERHPWWKTWRRELQAIWHQL